MVLKPGQGLPQRGEWRQTVSKLGQGGESLPPPSGVARNLRQGVCKVVLPLTSLAFPSPALPFPFHFSSLSLLSPPSPSIPLEVGPLNTARVSGERCKLSSGVWGGAPAEIDFDAF